MSLLEQIQSGRRPAPRRLMLYGIQGIGKSTYASRSPKPIFVQTEDGLGDIECDKFPLATSFEDVINALSTLYTETHPYQTIVVDSLDWLERLIWADVCLNHHVTSIEDIGYGKGYVLRPTVKARPASRIWYVAAGHRSTWPRQRSVSGCATTHASSASSSRISRAASSSTGPVGRSYRRRCGAIAA